MNYKAQLKGWAVDRVIELTKANNAVISMDELKARADELAEYCYIPDKDFTDCIAGISSLIKQAEDAPDALAKVNHVMAELAMLQEELQHRIAMRNAGNSNAQGETVQ